MTQPTQFNDAEMPDWELVKNQLVALRDSRSASLSASEDSFLIVLFIADLGYLVTGIGVGEKDYFTLIERVRGDDPVRAFDGGDTHVYPRHSFVSEATMLKAAEAYYRTGQRDATCEWVPYRDAYYE